MKYTTMNTKTLLQSLSIFILAITLTCNKTNSFYLDPVRVNLPWPWNQFGQQAVSTTTIDELSKDAEEDAIDHIDNVTAGLLAFLLSTGGAFGIKEEFLEQQRMSGASLWEIVSNLNLRTHFKVLISLAFCAGISTFAIYSIYIRKIFRQNEKELIEEAKLIESNILKTEEMKNLINFSALGYDYCSTDFNGWNWRLLPEYLFYQLARALRSQNYLFQDQYSVEADFGCKVKYSIWKIVDVIKKFDDKIENQEKIGSNWSISSKEDWDNARWGYRGFLLKYHDRFQHIGRILDTHSEYITLFETIETVKEQYSDMLEALFTAGVDTNEIIKQYVENASDSNKPYTNYANQIQKFVSLLQNQLVVCTEYPSLCTEGKEYSEKLSMVLDQIEKSSKHLQETI